jgi:hypothetical protein
MTKPSQAEDFESGLQGTEPPIKDPVKRGAHVLTHFVPEGRLTPKAKELAEDFQALADKLATFLPPSNQLTSALERLLDSRNMSVRYLLSQKK